MAERKRRKSHPPEPATVLELDDERFAFAKYRESWEIYEFALRRARDATNDATSAHQRAHDAAAHAHRCMEQAMARAGDLFNAQSDARNRLADAEEARVRWEHAVDRARWDREEEAPGG